MGMVEANCAAINRALRAEAERDRYRAALEEIIRNDEAEGDDYTPDWYCALRVQADVAREALGRPCQT